MRLEYRLDGADSDWTVSSLPRVAYYGQLRAGTYRFRVRAWNEDGVPGASEATLDFRVLAAWYQQWWFIALGTIAVVSAITGAALLVQRERNRRRSRATSQRFEAVLAERSRLARELHDTLLQGFTGLTLKIDGVRNRLEDQENPNAEELSQILHVADRSLREAREMVWEMREPSGTPIDVVDRLEQECRALPNPQEVVISQRVSGPTRNLSPEVGVPLLRIGREALSNALRHATARRIDVRLTFEPHLIVLEVQDDGRGVDPEQLDRAILSGHWGVAGMRERTRIAGGTLTVRTAPGEGMCVIVTLPTPATSPSPDG